MDKQVYTFIVAFKHMKNINRTMEVEGSTSLEDFAKVIVSAFDFEFDYAFGFYDNLKSHYDSKEAYTVLADDGMPVSRKEKSVKNTHVHEVFVTDKKMAFLFDYGNEWMFTVECLGVADPKAGVSYPIVTKIKGEAPRQQPGYDEDEVEIDEDYK